MPNPNRPSPSDSRHAPVRRSGTVRASEPPSSECCSILQASTELAVARIPAMANPPSASSAYSAIRRLVRTPAGPRSVVDAGQRFAIRIRCSGWLWVGFT